MVFPIHSYLILRLIFFCFNQIFIPRQWFFVHMRHFDIDFLFFFAFVPVFRNGFPNSLIVRSRSSFLFSQWKFFELHTRTCPTMFFISSSRFLLRPYDITICFLFIRSCNFNWFACVTSQSLQMWFLIAALIFSAGYYSAPFFTSSNKKMFRFTSFCRFINIVHIIVNKYLCFALP